MPARKVFWAAAFELGQIFCMVKAFSEVINFAGLTLRGFHSGDL